MAECLKESDTSAFAVEQSSLCFQPVLSAMKVADQVRRGATVLRYMSFVVVAMAVVGEYLRWDDAEFTKADFGFILGNLTFPIALAALLVAFSFVLQNSAARLNLNIVLAHEQAGLTD